MLVDYGCISMMWASRLLAAGRVRCYRLHECLVPSLSQGLRQQTLDNYRHLYWLLQLLIHVYRLLSYWARSRDTQMTDISHVILSTNH